jgi:hypothetical protein
VNFLHRRLAGLDAWFARRTAFLTHPRAGLWAALLVPVLLGLVSMMSGQDDGWDMRNYHLYNVHALLNGRIGFDLAPAGFQSYFNPTLDLHYYYLNSWLSPRAAGFVLGVLQGLNFVLLVGIAYQLIGSGTDDTGGRRRLVLLLAGACMFGPGFLSELGNVMGDNMTALLVLASLYLSLRAWPLQGGRALLVILAAGLVMGLSTGLKLTNAAYAVALCAALLLAPGAWWQRLRLAFVFGIGVLTGTAAAAGWWFFKMWNTFGNPLFPQFNNLFHSPLAPETGVIDIYFRPHNVLENLLWPFIFAFDTRRVSELPMKLTVWPVLYALMVALLVRWLLGRRRGAGLLLSARSLFILVFFALAYLIWMRMFSIYRYLAPLELLAPLAIWIVWQAVAPGAQRVGAVLLVALALGVFPVANWGHAEWAGKTVSADVPPFAAPADSIVFFSQPDPPSGWMGTLLPPQVQVISLDTGMPETPAWLARQQVAITARPGPHYLLLPAARNDRDGTRLRKLAAARWLGLTDDAAGCGRLESLMRHVRLQVELRRLPAGGCTFGLLPQHRIDLAARDRESIGRAAQKLPRYGLQLDTASCTTYQAAVGREPHPYLLCAVTKAGL